MNVAVILAGGKGLRLGNTTPKQMLILGNRPVISWSVDTFHKTDLIDQIIIVSEKNLINGMRRLFPAEVYPKISAFIEGGEERSDSSYNAIISSDFNDEDIFLFHDAARPFVSEEIIIETIKGVNISGACGTYVQSADTIALAGDSIVEQIPERRNVYSAQTPQGFRYDLIRKAHLYQREVKNTSITDDVSLVFNMGVKVSIIRGNYQNIKITTETDFRFAEFLISGGNKC
jgi:2-C-methyl-D-erythritol 4-phosphate cytidylyltransferase